MTHGVIPAEAGIPEKIIKFLFYENNKGI